MLCASVSCCAKFVENRIFEILQAVAFMTTFQRLSRYQKSSNTQTKSKSKDVKQDPGQPSRYLPGRCRFERHLDCVVALQALTKVQGERIALCTEAVRNI